MIADNTNRRTNHPVWDFVLRDNDSTRWKCVLCGHSFKNATTHNLMRHLLRRHEEQHQHCEQVVKEKKDASEATRSRRRSPLQPAVEDCSRALVQLVLHTSIPYRIVESTYFKDFVKAVTASPNFNVPGRKALTKLAEEECSRIVSVVKDHLQHAKSVAICADICTQRGMTRSYIAFTAHFFDHQRGLFERVLLDMVELQGRHTAAAIKKAFDAVMISYGLSVDKVTSFYNLSIETSDECSLLSFRSPALSLTTATTSCELLKTE